MNKSGYAYGKGKFNCGEHEMEENKFLNVAKCAPREGYEGCAKNKDPRVSVQPQQCNEMFHWAEIESLNSVRV